MVHSREVGTEPNRSEEIYFVRVIRRDVEWQGNEDWIGVVIQNVEFRMVERYGPLFSRMAIEVGCGCVRPGGCGRAIKRTKNREKHLFAGHPLHRSPFSH